MLRELQPGIALFENVPGIFVSSRGEFFNGILTDIHECGFDAEWQIISALEAGAPHLRRRLWVVCYQNNRGDVAIIGALLMQTWNAVIGVMRI